MLPRRNGSPRAMLGLAIVAVLAACGAAGPSPAAAPAAEAEAPAASAHPDRSLPSLASFAELVALARESADEAGRAPGERCLLGHDGEATIALRGDLALAIRPLPDPAGALDAALRASPREAALLSLFGAFGRGPIVVAAFTPMPPPARDGAVVVVLARGGVEAHVRSTGAIAANAPRTEPESLAAVVGPMVAAGASPIVVSAEADVPLEAVDAALAALSELGTPVALGVALDPGIRTPRALRAGEDVRAEPRPACAAAPPGNPPDRAALREALAPMAEKVRSCRRGTASADAARGGLVRLRIHAGADGRVGEACASSEELGDTTLLACLEGSAMELALPPTPQGFAAELPIRIERDASFDRAPRCAE